MDEALDAVNRPRAGKQRSGETSPRYEVSRLANTAARSLQKVKHICRSHLCYARVRDYNGNGIGLKRLCPSQTFQSFPLYLLPKNRDVGGGVAREPAHLRIVDTETGALHELDECPNCRELDRELRRQRTVIANLRRDKDSDAKGHKLWPLAVALFWEYRIATDRMRCKWSADRFFACLPFLEEDGFDLCRFAVWGVSAHPNTKQITPTYSEVYNDWELVFRSRGTFERYANRGKAIFGDELPVEPVT